MVSAGLIMMATVNSIAGMELSVRASWAGIPGTVFLLVTAGGALAWGVLMERADWRGGLLFGLATAAGGLLSGVIFASLGYAMMGFIGAVLAVIPLFLTYLWWNAGRGNEQAGM